MSILLCGREIEALILDVDGNLYTQEIVNKSYLPIQTYLAELTLFSPGHTTLPHQIVESRRQAYVHASIAGGSFSKTFFNMGGEPDDYKTVEGMVRTNEHIEFNPLLLSMLTTLHKVTKLAILSQGRQAKINLIMEKLIGPDWYSHFDLISCGDTADTIQKPHPRAFLDILSSFQVSPEKSAMVGDTDASDIAPAVSLGMLGIQVEKNDSKCAHLYLQKVTDLVDHISLFPPHTIKV